MANLLDSVGWWLADFQLGSFVLLTLGCCLMLAVRPGAPRTAAGWGTAFSLIVLALLASISQRPTMLRLSSADIDAPVTTTVESKIQTNVASAEPPDRPDGSVKSESDISTAPGEDQPIGSDEASSSESAPLLSERPTANTRASALQGEGVPASDTDRTPQSRAHLPLSRWLTGLWMAGSFVTAVWSAFGWCSVRRILKRSHASSEETRKLARKALGNSALPQILVSDAVPHAVVTGVFKPAIVLPDWFLKATDPEELQAILRHEAAHIRNRDLWLFAVLRALGCLLYLQPLLWFMKRMIRDSQELLADHAAAQGQGTDYAARLVAWAREATSMHGSRMIPVAGVFKRSERLSRRVAALLGNGVPVEPTCRWRSRVTLLATLLTTTLMASMATTRSAPAASDPQAALENEDAGRREAEESSKDGENKAETAAMSDSIRGIVRGPRGTLVEGATVVLRERPYAWRGSSGLPTPAFDLAVTKTDARGRFVFSRVSQLPMQSDYHARDGKKWGPFDVVVVADGLAAAWALARSPESIVFNLKPGLTISGRLVDSKGEPVSDSRVRVVQFGQVGAVQRYNSQDGYPESSHPHYLAFRDARQVPLEGRTNASGRFEIQSIPRERCMALIADHPDYVQREFYIATTDKPQKPVRFKAHRTVYNETVHTKTPTIELTRGGEIHLNVVFDDTGKPALGASVDPGPTIGDDRLPVDDQGVYVMRQLSGGGHSVSVRAPEGTPYLGRHFDSLTVTKPGHVQEIDVRLPRAAIVTGRVVNDKTGKGIPNVSVFTFLKGTRNGGRTTTGEDGSFRLLTPPGEGEVFLYGNVPGFLAAHWTGPSVTPKDGFRQPYQATLETPKDNVEFRLKPTAVISGTVVDPDGKPAAGVSIRTTYLPLETTRGFRNWKSDDKGRFALDDLFSNQDFKLRQGYVVGFYDRERKLGTVLKVEQVKDPLVSPPPLRVELKQMLKTTGRVVDEAGKPVPGAEIILHEQIWNRTLNHQLATRTGPQGRFTFESGRIPDAKRYFVGLRKEGFQEHGLVAVQDDKPLEITLTKVPVLTKMKLPQLKGLAPEEAFAALSKVFPDQGRPLKNVEQRWRDTYAVSYELLELARKNGQSEVALKCCTRILDGRLFWHKEAKPLQDVQYEAAQILRRDFIDRKELARYVDRIIYDNRKLSAESARRLADESPHADVAAAALYSSAMIKLNAARWGQGLQPQTRSECIAVMNRILNEYGDVVDQHGRKVAALAATTLRQLEFYSIGSKPKDIVGETLDGKQMKLSDYQGRIIVLAFWAKWSTGNGATQEHLEQFSLIADRLKDRGVVVLGVAMDKPDAARKLVKEFKATFPSWVDGGARRISREWNARGHNVYLIDRSGVIRHTNVRASQLEGRVLNLVREAEAADKKQ